MKKLATITLLGIIFFTCTNNTVESEQQSVSINGKNLFKSYCVTCHGINGKMALNGAKDLSVSTLSIEERIQIIKEGKNIMSSFKSVLNPRQIEAVANYTLELKQQ